MGALHVDHRGRDFFALSPQEVSELGVKIGLVVSLFNATVTKALADQCRSRLAELGVSPQCVVLFFVPGSLELPIVLQCLLKTGVVHGVVGIGCVLRGATYHYDVVLKQAFDRIMELSASGHCVVNGIIAAESMPSAREQLFRGRCWADQITEAVVWSRLLQERLS